MKPLALAFFPCALFAQLPGITLPPLEPSRDSIEIPVIQNTFRPPQAKAPRPLKLQRTGSARNWVCNEKIVRYRNEEMLDVITLRVSYESGVDSYSDVRLNGRPIRDLPRSGAMTYGDYGSMLENLMPDVPMVVDHKTSYLVHYDLTEANGVFQWQTVGESLPPNIASVRWSIKPYSEGVIPREASFDVLYRVRWDRV